MKRRPQRTALPHKGGTTIRDNNDSSKDLDVDLKDKHSKEVKKDCTVKIPPRPERDHPQFGMVKGIKIVDPNWADPMADDELDKILADRY